MAVAYTDRCPASSWRGAGSAPPKNRCKFYERAPHPVHRDENGNNFIIDEDGVAHVVDLHGRRLN